LLDCLGIKALPALRLHLGERLRRKGLWQAKFLVDWVESTQCIDFLRIGK
jgi:hypothetical protein